jgi:hypothetical protein
LLHPAHHWPLLCNGSINNNNQKGNPMKRIQLFAVLAAVLAVVTCTTRAADPGPVIFKMTATSQAIYDQASYKTNAFTSTVTNITVTTLYTVSNGVIDSTRLLQMLANSFDTIFPDGAQLKLNDSSEFVVAVGTNVVQIVTNVLSLTTSNNPVYGGSMVTSYKLDHTGESVNNTLKYTETVSGAVVYDDSGRATADGKTTRMTLRGVETFKGNDVMTGTTKFNYLFSFTGDGQGSVSNSVSNNEFILRGGFTGAVSGIGPVGP